MIGLRRSVRLGVLLLVLPVAIRAQQPAIGVGQSVQGSLETTDSRLEDESHYDLYLFRGAPGERIRITLRSADFDAYLAWGPWDGSDLSVERSDDDSGGGTDSRMSVTVRNEGTYAIRANSLEGGRTGAYTLTVEPAPAVSVTTQPIALGQTVAGRLDETDPVADDDSWFDVYLYGGAPGERVRVTLRSSEFDAYLSVGDWDGADFMETASDDDGGGETDAQLSATVGPGGTLAIRANSFSGGESGAYTLLVEREPGPPAGR